MREGNFPLLLFFGLKGNIVMKERIDVLLPNMDAESSVSPYDAYVREDLQNRILLINEQITDLVVDEQVMCILRWNAEDRNIPTDKRKPITIYLNSEGGSSFDGQALIDVMLASKTPIKTVGIGMVASMAYLIFIAGHERISFPNSCLLMHEGNTSVGGVSSKARDTMAFFDDMEERMKKFILSRTSITEEKYEEVYKKEWWMYAQEAKQFGIVDKIIGEDCDIDILF